MNVPLTFEFMHQTTHPSFARVISVMKNHVHPLTKTPAPLVSDAFYDVVMANAEMLDNAIDHDMDFTYDYCGYKTLERSLVKLDGKLLERPQHLLMRVALAIHLPDLPLAIASYKLMSERYFTHAAPTLFNAGAPRPQLSSCFLLAMKEDSIEGIYDTLKQCAMISKLGGGIGLSVHSIRATNSYVAGSNGLSNGLVPMLRVFNNTARYISRGGGGAKGSYAVYLEPWHADLLAFLDLKKRTGNELDRARDLFFALWVPDLFMERVDKGMDWTLMCPNECPGLADCHGEEFKKLYEKYEELGKGRTTVKAQSVRMV